MGEFFVFFLKPLRFSYGIMHVSLMYKEEPLMITWHEELNFDFKEAMTAQYFTEEAIFFDIETTGFTPARSSLYLIGCATRSGDKLYIDQFFAESKTEEANVIAAFFSLLSQYHTIITFNGIGFDIPYLKGKCEILKLASSFDAYTYIDIYKEVSKQKALLGLASLKQKSIELFLGIDRRDVYSGGELIEVYHSYAKHPSDEALSLLRYHNYEDVLYMPKLLPVLSYQSALTGKLLVSKLETSESKTFDGTTAKELIFTLTSTCAVPKPLSYRYDDCYLTFSQTQIRLCIRLYDGELKFFFDNPKDYYYLPDEDCAVLKKIASGVDKEHRRQANTTNCYQKKHAIFLPQYETLFTPAFRQHTRDKKSYFELSEEFISSPSLQENYVKHLLSHMNATRAFYNVKKPSV